MPNFKELQHEYDSSRGLWCIDRNPAEVDYEWIKRNAFQLKDNLKGKPHPAGEIRIGAYELGTGTTPGRIWMKSPSGQTSEVDEKVLEDVLKSFF